MIKTLKWNHSAPGSQFHLSFEHVDVVVKSTDYGKLLSMYQNY